MALGLLVGPVRRHAELSVLVHGVGADLHLQRLGLRPLDRRVQRLIEVALGGGDVVVELLGDMAPESMHHAERGIAVGHRVDQDAHGAQVEDVGDVDVLALHLLPDAVDVFGTAGDLGADAQLVELLAQSRHDLGDIVLALLAPLGQQLGDAPVFLGLEIAQRQVFQLPLDLPDAEPVGQRGIDALGVARDLGAPLGFQILDRTHQMHPLGQHHQHHAHVLGDAEQQAAQVLLVLGLILGGDHSLDVGELIDARQIVDHARDAGTEPFQ